jgi:glycosyltransferase involved in cell wall biosynthesis
LWFRRSWVRAPSSTPEAVVERRLPFFVDFASGDCVISIDGDFQHPAELIPEMIEKWKEGYDIVYTKRLENKNSGFFKRYSARLFYKILTVFLMLKLNMDAQISGFSTGMLWIY